MAGHPRRPADRPDRRRPLPVQHAAVGGDGDRRRRPATCKIAMMLNNNGQAITLANDLAAAGYGDLEAAADALARGEARRRWRMTFPGGTHDIWLRYWLAATGADRRRRRRSIPIPPPQMVAEHERRQRERLLRRRAVERGGRPPGHRLHPPRHPGHLGAPPGEGARGQRRASPRPRPTSCEDLMGAVLQAGKWLDDPDNRAKAADTLGAEAYVNAPPDEIRGRLTGVYDLGAGLGEKTFDGNQMRFFRDGQVNFPRRAHAIWFLAQYQRLGLPRRAAAVRGDRRRADPHRPLRRGRRGRGRRRPRRRHGAVRGAARRGHLRSGDDPTQEAARA